MFKLKDTVDFLPEILQKHGYYTSRDTITDKVASPRGFNIIETHNEYEDDLIIKHPDLIKRTFEEAEGKPIFTFLQFSRIHTVTVSEVVKDYEWNDQKFYENKNENMKAFDEAFNQSCKYAKKIKQTIEELGKTNETILIFFTDHGTGIGERFGERNYGVFTFEETIRTFHLFIGPNITKNVVCDKMLSSIDLFPTILELCNIKGDFVSSGMSFAPYIYGNSKNIGHSEVFSETGGLQGPFPSPFKPNVFCIRTKSHKLIYFKTTNEWLLFDLEKDPKEENNLIGKNLSEEKILREKLLNWINRE